MTIDPNITLTAAGRRWARENSLVSMVANVALHGWETKWPTNHVLAAIQVANENGEKKASV